MYGLAVNTEECFNDIMTGAEKMDKLIEYPPYGVIQDLKRGYHIFLYRTEEAREKAYKIAEAAGFEDFCELNEGEE